MRAFATQSSHQGAALELFLQEHQPHGYSVCELSLLRTAHSAQEAGTDSFVSCWLLQWVLDVAVRMLLLGFELALYQPHEHFMIYWWVCVLECIRSRLQVP